MNDLRFGKEKFGAGFPWILCDLMPHGKRVVRGSPDNLKALWTFCPKKKFPKDKIKVSECEQCSHFQGYRKTFSTQVVKSLDQFGTLSRAFRVQKPEKSESKPSHFNVKKKLKSKPVKKGDLENALTEKKRKDEEWLEEERRIFGDSKDREREN
jgi:hypothetical protein